MSGLDWLPAHKCGLYLSHNEHKDVYETVEKFYYSDDFVSKESLERAISNNEVWSLQWYPDTPIGSYTVCANTLEEIQTYLKGMK